MNNGKKTFTTTMMIAEGVKLDHRSVVLLLKKYEDEVLSLTRLASFELTKVKTAGRPVLVYHLDEIQATFLLTLMSNSTIVVKFKKTLTTEFFKQRELIAKLIASHDKPNWQEVRATGKAVYHQKTDVIKLFIEYAIEQGSKSATRYYANFAKIENTALFVLEQKYPNVRDVLDIRQLTQVSVADQIIEKALAEGMSKKLPYKDCFKLAKERVVSFSEIMGKSPVISLEQLD